MRAARTMPLTALALAVGLLAPGPTSAQDHSQHQVPLAQDHSQHQSATKPAATKNAKPPVAEDMPVPATPEAEIDHAAMGHDMPVPATPAAEVDHAAMGHDTPMPATPAAEVDHAAMGHDMPVPATPAAEMDHAAMGHAAPAAAEQPLTPIPALTDADRAAAFPDLQRHMEHAPEVNSYVLFDRLEAWDANPGTGQAWEGLAWIGTDLDRVWLRSEGERSGGHTEAADLEVLYGRSVSPWWDVVAGIKHDFQPGSSQTWAAFGVQGLSPYKFEVQATAYVGASGRTAANVEVEYETLLTNRLILQPLVEVSLHGKDDPGRGIGSGLSTVEAGLRLRYEFTRRFAPYIGVVHERAFGGTADFRRAEGEDAHDTRVVAGLRIWF